MRSLIWKEVRAQLPFMLLMVFISVVGYLAHALSDPLSQMKTAELYGQGLIQMRTEWSVISFLIAIGISYGLLAREFDDRTIDFLDALPVSRTQVFFSKWVAAALTLSLFPILDGFLTIGIRTLSRDSLDRSFHLPWIVKSVALSLIQFYCFLSIGLLLSFLRRLGWLVLGGAVWALMLVGKFVPEFQLMNLSLFSNTEFAGKTWLFPWRLAIQYLVVTIAMTGMAYGMFMGWGQHLLAILSGSDSRWKQVALMGVSAATFVVLIGVMVTAEFDRDEEERREIQREVIVDYPSWETSRRRTDRFDAMYPQNMAKRANGLLDHADADFETVAAFFDYDDPKIVVADMTASSGHTLGTAYWNKLRISLGSHESVNALRRTLGHEATHVVIESLSDGELRKNAGSVRFFHEGVATYVERRFFTDKSLMDHRIGPALLMKREEVNFNRLVDDERLRAESDTFLVYSLGEVFAAAVVRRYGDESLGRLARTFAEKRHTEGLSGIPLWRSIFQAAGYSLSATTDEYYRLLEEAEKHHRDTVAKLPLLRPVVAWQNGWMDISIDEEPPEGWKIVGRFRASENATDNEYWTREYNGVAFGAYDHQFVGRLAWYQVGYRQEDEMPIFQKWTKVRKPRGN